MMLIKNVETYNCDTEVEADSLIEKMRNEESEGTFELKKYTKERKEKKPTKADPEGLEFWICTFYKLYI